MVTYCVALYMCFVQMGKHAMRRQRRPLCSNRVEHVHAHQRRVDDEGARQQLVQPVQVALRVRDERLQRLQASHSDTGGLPMVSVGPAGPSCTAYGHARA